MPYCFTLDASRIFEEIANAFLDSSSAVWWKLMQELVCNEDQAHSARQKYFNLNKLPDETKRSYADWAWCLASSLTGTLTKALVKPQVIKCLFSQLQMVTFLAQALPFDAMVSTIEQVIDANTQKKTQDNHRQYRGR